MKHTSSFLPLLLTLSFTSSACFIPRILKSNNSSTSISSSLVFTPASGSVGTLLTLTGADFSSVISADVGGTSAVIVASSATSLKLLIMPDTSYGRITVVTGSGSITSADFFTVTATPFPANQQGAKLVGTGNIGGATLGTVAAVSADGNTAIIGGESDNTNQGATWVFTRSGGVWSQQGAKLVGTGNIGPASQGASVAVSADGNTAIIGGYGDNSSVGATWVFTRSEEGVWSQQGAKLVGTGNIGAANQGRSVAVSADGNTAIIGGDNDNSSVGATWVFTRSGGVWSQQGAKLVGTGNIGAAVQGTSVAVSADGNTAIIGGYNDNTLQGATWVFTRSGGVWSQQGAKLVGTGNTGAAQQGGSVAVSADGNTALIGGAFDNTNQGATWVFTRSGGVWSQQGAKLIGTGNIGAALQGFRVAVSADGNTAISGGYDDNTAQGATWVFTRSGGVWSQQGAKLVGTGNIGAASQGGGVAVSADGSTTIIGGYSDNTSQGAAWVFTP